MDQYSSGEDVVTKARKPYTITKQRERWTEDEHTRFLEALKLYGRAWQRIEEYIGTKTAVQIRSHAQKFFSKLEKEALVKGVANNQALDIDIPPPRPKRKPNNPYPRKTGSISPTGAKDGKALPSASSPCLSKQPLDLEKEPHFEKPGREEKTEKSKEYQDDCGSDVFMQEASSTSFSSANKNFNSIPTPLRNSCSIKGFVPLIKEVTQNDGVCQSYITYESKSYENMDRRDDKQKILDKGNLENSRSSNEKPAQTDETQSTQNYPRHVPVHILDGSQGTSYSSFPDQSHQGSTFDQLRGIYGLPHLFFNLSASATNLPRSLHRSFPNLYAPAIPMLNCEDDYQSCLQFSSAFSSLILSTLLQNPAAHAAASFAAATCWPSANAEASTDSVGGFPSQKVNQGGPSMVAIAAATVAAATAWWAANGLLPLCTPFHAHNGFTCAPSSTNADQSAGPSSGKQENNLQDSELQDQPMEPDLNEDLQPQHSASNESPVLSSLDPDGSGEVTKAENKAGSSEAIGKDKSTITEMELNDSDKITKGRKPVDRSSCGSNTTSSSDVETDALKKQEKVTEASIEPETCNPKASHPMIESINRRGRFMSNVNDSWKEVSEEGRLAFRALFSQEVLPQSFTRNMKIDGNQKILKEFKHKMDDNAENASLLDLNCQTSESFPSHQGVGICAPDGTKNDAEDSLLNIGLGYGKQACRTGFKPYKRCSVEAKERMPSGSSQADEKGTKRIRLEEEAST